MNYCNNETVSLWYEGLSTYRQQAVQTLNCQFDNQTSASPNWVELKWTVVSFVHTVQYKNDAVETQKTASLCLSSTQQQQWRMSLWQRYRLAVEDAASVCLSATHVTCSRCHGRRGQRNPITGRHCWHAPPSPPTLHSTYVIIGVMSYDITVAKWNMSIAQSLTRYLHIF